MKNILFVDNDPSHREVLSVALRTVVDWNVIREADAQSAVAALTKNVRIDVIFICCETPGLKPLSFMAMVSSLKPKVPVIVLSRNGNKDMHQKMMNLGAFEHMSGPVTVIELVRVIRSALLKAEQGERQGNPDMKMDQGIGKVLIDPNDKDGF